LQIIPLIAKFVQYDPVGITGENSIVNEPFNFPCPRRITVFIGAYGSGKSEVSTNFAVWLAQSGRKVTLCDLDMINPYFRSADARAQILPLGVDLISPQFAGTNVDVPAMPSAVHSIFDRTDRYGVLDIGGEDLGARVVAALRPQLLKNEVAVYMVVNTSRPYTNTASQIVRQARSLIAAAGMQLDGLVQNTNLLEYSEPLLLEAGDDPLDQAAALLNVPVVFKASLVEAVPQSWLQSGQPVLLLRRFINYPDQK
jgi:hypothetical protein